MRYGGPDAAPVTTDGRHPETSDLVAGWWMIDVYSDERAVELAAYVSTEPGPLDEGALRALVPRVLASLVCRGEDFDAAEDALQDALLEALRVWPERPPRDPPACLATVATRRLVDARRSDGTGALQLLDALIAYLDDGNAWAAERLSASLAGSSTPR